MTLMKLAELAGVSVATVSKAFSGSKEIGNTTREHIFALAKEHGCFEKYYKSPRRRPLIALIFPEPESEFYGQRMGMLERSLDAHGADSIIAFSRFDPEREAELFRELAYGMHVDGIILAGAGKLINNRDEIPLVTFSGAENPDANADNVRVNLEGGIRQLLQTVRDYGHTEVGFIGESLTVGKETAFREASRKIGFSVYNDYIVRSDKRFMEAGEDGMRQLIERGKLPDVIVAAYDQIAYGAMKFAEQQGYRIPEDLSFVGIDDISPTPYLGIPLSSLHMDFEGVCEKVVKLIFKRIENKHYREPNDIVVPVSVMIRQSLKKVNEQRGSKQWISVKP
jgi:LacI family repressor for deo operon, udp, cdd, tsx, nupC, and nupG